jgi:ATP-dependent helicase/nuclease subunit A
MTRAVTLLESWHSLTGKLPVHDLLDKIYSDSNLIARYVAAYPAHLQHRVVANLNRFIELALEIDSGRYPSVGRFVYRLQTMRASEQDAPDQTPAGNSDARVRLLTIHAAKGLEAPVIFLADAANTVSAKDAYRAVVEWPAQDRRPQYFFMASRKTERDNWSREVLARQESAAEREDANLLYVAVTRAKQLLFVTGTPSKQRRDEGWYSQITAQLRNREDFADIPVNEALILETGNMPHQPVSTVNPPPPPTVTVDAGLSRPIDLPPAPIAIAPSLARSDTTVEALAPWSRTPSADDEDLQQRGIIIHKLLQWLAEARPQEYIRQQIYTVADGTLLPESLEEYWREAERVFNHSEFRYLFDPARYEFARNEAPISYPYGDNTIYGIVDRLVVTNNDVFIIDYKTHINTDPDYQRSLVEHYRIQMSLYEAGVKRLWPDKTVCAQLLFTHNATIADAGVIDIDTLQLSALVPA